MSEFYTQKREIIEEINYLRGFAILAVVAIHTSTNFAQISSINILLVVNVIVDVISHFAVPLFIFISGFVLSLKYKGLFSQKNFYKRRVESILPQYIIFSIIYVLLSIVDSTISGSIKLPSISKLIFDFFTANSYFHMWYFALIIQFYILYPYIIKIYESFENKNRILFLILLTLIIQQTWLIVKGTAIDYLNSSVYSNSITHFYTIINVILMRVFLSHIFYFILGIYVCQNWEYMIDKIYKNKDWTLTMIIIITGIISALWIEGIKIYGNYYSIPQGYFIFPDLIGSLYFPLIISTLIIMSLKFSDNKNKYLSYLSIISLIGKYSFGIYLIHALYIDILSKVVLPLYGIDINNVIFYPILFILTLLLSYFSVHLITYLPYSKILVGIKRIETDSVRF